MALFLLPLNWPETDSNYFEQIKIEMPALTSPV